MRNEGYSEVCAGWWPILDKYIQQLRAIDPNCEIYIKEKYGTLRIHAVSENHTWKEFREIERAAENASMTVCEVCGAPGKAKMENGWIQTLCNRCATLTPAEREIVANQIGENYIKKIF